MKINSTRFGSLEIQDQDLLYFPEGLVGFAAHKRFFIYNREQNRPFFWLHSVDNPNLAFVICDPQLFFPDYRVSVRKEELSLLNVKDPQDVIVCVLISITREPFRMSANLQGPLVINTASRTGKQLVLVDGSYGTRHELEFVRREELSAGHAFAGRPEESRASSLVLV